MGKFSAGGYWGFLCKGGVTSRHNPRGPFWQKEPPRYNLQGKNFGTKPCMGGESLKARNIRTKRKKSFFKSPHEVGVHLGCSWKGL